MKKNKASKGHRAGEWAATLHKVTRESLEEKLIREYNVKRCIF